MSNLDNIVNVSITTTTKTPTAKGFGTPLIMAYTTLWTDADRVYSDLNGMVSDGFMRKDPAYLAAEAMLSANPRVQQFKIGRRTNPWIQIVDLVPAAPSTGLVYTITIDGTKVTYTALGGDNLAAVCTALATAMNAVNPASATAIIATGGVSTNGSQVYSGAALNGTTGRNSMLPLRCLEIAFNANAAWTGGNATINGTDGNGNAIQETYAIAVGGGTTVKGTKQFATVTEVDIPAQAGAGGTFTVGVQARFGADGSSGTKVRTTSTLPAVLIPYAHTSATSNLTLTDATADSGIAADLNALIAKDADWYGLTLDSNGTAEIEAAAAWAETHEIVFTAQTCDTAVSDTASGSDTTSVAYALKGDGYLRTHLDFKSTIGTDFIAAAILGSRLPVDPGSDTWAFKTLPGVAPDVLTPTQETNLAAKNVGCYETIAGINVTVGGKTSGGEWVDVIRFRDWLKARIQERIFALLVNNPKVAYTDKGIALVTGAIRTVIGDGVRAGGVDGDSAITVTAPAVADIDPTVRATRVLPSVNFGCRLAGAIHVIDINGSLTS